MSLGHGANMLDRVGAGGVDGWEHIASFAGGRAGVRAQGICLHKGVMRSGQPLALGMCWRKPAGLQSVWAKRGVINGARTHGAHHSAQCRHGPARKPRDNFQSSGAVTAAVLVYVMMGDRYDTIRPATEHVVNGSRPAGTVAWLQSGSGIGAGSIPVLVSMDIMA